LSSREVVDFEEGFYDVGPLDVGIHACYMDRVESSAVLEVYDTSILKAIPVPDIFPVPDISDLREGILEISRCRWGWNVWAISVKL
jgi:hypothetical protein